MTFIRVFWKHQLPSEPVEIYSELDSERWEMRKVEVFADGAMVWADGDRQFGATRLAVEPLPSSHEISKDPQFEVIDITGDEFERVWQRAHC